MTPLPIGDMELAYHRDNAWSGGPTGTLRRVIRRLDAAEEALAELRSVAHEVEWDSVLNCIEACQNDPAEPERYREAYVAAFNHVKAFLATLGPLA